MMFRSGLRADQDSHFIRLQVLQHFFRDVDIRNVLLPNPFVLSKLSVRPNDKGCLQIIKIFEAVLFALKTFIIRLLKLEMASKMMTPPPPAPSVAQQQRSKLEDGRCQFKSPVALVDLACQPSGVFRGLLPNSRKYGLRSLRKSPMEGNPPIGLGPS